MPTSPIHASDDAREGAQSVRTLELTPTEQAALLALLQTPSEPTPALVEAMAPAAALWGADDGSVQNS